MTLLNIQWNSQVRSKSVRLTKIYAKIYENLQYLKKYYLYVGYILGLLIND